MKKDRLASYFHFSSAAYKSNNSDFPHVVSGYSAQKIEGFSAKDSSFAAQMYVSFSRDEHGIPLKFRVAFRGSDDKWDFAQADTAFAGGKWQEQMTDAVKFVGLTIMKIREQYPTLSLDDVRERLDVTGHSLGGGLAEITAKFYGVGGMSIDGPGALGPINSSKFQELKSDIRARIPELADEYMVGKKFEARRYTSVGTAGRHLPEITVTTSETLSRYLEELGRLPPFAYAFDMGGISISQAASGLGSLASHPMAAIAKEEGIPPIELSNLAAGLSASGYVPSDQPYFSPGSNRFRGTGAIRGEAATQILVTKDPGTGAIMEARTEGKMVDGRFFSDGGGTSVTGLDPSGRMVIQGPSAKKIFMELGLPDSDITGSGKIYSAAISLGEGGGKTTEFRAVDGMKISVLEEQDKSRTVVLSNPFTSGPMEAATTVLTYNPKKLLTSIAEYSRDGERLKLTSMEGLNLAHTENRTFSLYKQLENNSLELTRAQRAVLARALAGSGSENIKVEKRDDGGLLFKDENGRFLGSVEKVPSGAVRFLDSAEKGFDVSVDGRTQIVRNGSEQGQQYGPSPIQSRVRSR